MITSMNTLNPSFAHSSFGCWELRFESLFNQGRALAFRATSAAGWNSTR